MKYTAIVPNGVGFYEPPVKLLEDAMEAATDSQLQGHGSHGPEVAEFEAAIAAYHNVEPEMVVCTDSCTSAMSIACMVGGADEVAVPAITWNATPNAAQFAGCDVHIMPVDENTGLGLVAMIDDECDTVIGVDLYGQLSDEPAEDVAWIVDAAHSFEADIRRQARVTCFSFHTLKALPIGVGGAALFQTSIDADEARLLRWQGVDTDRIQKTVGMKATMPAFAAAMGISMLRGLNDREAVRRSVVNRYEELIDPDLLMEVRYADDCHDCCHAFVVKVANRHELRRELDAVGIGTAFYYPSLRSHPHWRSSKGVGKQVHFGEQLIALPCHSQMDEEHVEYVATHVNNLAVRTP